MWRVRVLCVVSAVVACAAAVCARQQKCALYAGAPMSCICRCVSACCVCVLCHECCVFAWYLRCLELASLWFSAHKGLWCQLRGESDSQLSAQHLVLLVCHLHVIVIVLWCCPYLCTVSSACWHLCIWGCLRVCCCEATGVVSDTGVYMGQKLSVCLSWNVVSRLCACSRS